MKEPAPSVQSPTPTTALAGYEVLVAVSGGIAAFKTAALVSTLVQQGAGVSVAMTRAARRFITPLTFEALTRREVFTSLWQSGTEHDAQHLSHTETADLVIVAPATANLLAKLAHGLADDVVSTLLLAVDCPLLLAPAMNTRMWQNPAVRENVETLRRRGCHIVEPGSGWLACRTVGEGRMAEPSEILEQAVALLRSAKPRSRGK